MCDAIVSTAIALTYRSKVLACSIARVVYNIWFHPLSKVPGPLLESAIYFPTGYKIFIKGTGPGAMKKWHEKYGPVVRIGPNRLSFDGEIGWPAIFGHRKPGQPEYEKVPSIFGEKRHLLVAKKEIHRRQRRQLAHAFSDASLVQQELIVNKYIDMLMDHFTKQAQSGETLDIVKWFNFTTFDIIGDLAFSESFRSLESRSYNPWVLAIFQGIRGGALLRMLYNYPLADLIVKIIKLSPKVRTLNEIRSHARNKAIARMEYGAERMEGHKDFTTYMMKTNRDGAPGMDREEILQNAPTIVLAGSETTATSLSGFCFYVGQHPDVYAKLAAEIRLSFSSEADISMTSTAALQYLAAVINETLRVYPPVASTPERHSPGALIDEQYIPAGVSQPPAKTAYLEPIPTKLNRLSSLYRSGTLSATLSTGSNQTRTFPNAGCQVRTPCTKSASSMIIALFLNPLASALGTALAKTSHIQRCVLSLRGCYIALTLSSSRGKRTGKASKAPLQSGKKGHWM